MKIAYEISWLDHSIKKIEVPDEWTQEDHNLNCDYLVWATFNAARDELISGLKSEIEELRFCDEDTYFR